MLSRFITFISEYRLCNSNDRLLIAFSGGRDSVCLAHLLKKAGYHISLAHVNYGLRGAESDADEDFARSFARSQGLEIFVHKEALHKGANLQARAREVRYAFFQRTALERGFHAIATAHHRDDHLETFFVQLLRGGSLASLGGIPEKNGNIIRPLHFASRADIDAYIRENDLPHREDSSNASTDYLRNRVRQRLIPVLGELESGVDENLTSVMTRWRQHTSAVSSLARSFFTDATQTRIALDHLPENHREFWLHQAVKGLGFTPTQCSNILFAEQPGKEVCSATHRMVIQGQWLDIAEIATVQLLPLEVTESGTYRHEDFELNVLLQASCKPSGSNYSVCLDADAVSFPILLRPWRAGDRFQPLGMPYQVKVQDYLTDKKVGKLRKERTWVAISSGRIFWIPGMAIAEHAKIADGTGQRISLEFSYIRK